MSLTVDAAREGVREFFMPVTSLRRFWSQGAVRPEVTREKHRDATTHVECDMMWIPGGSFRYGEELEQRELPGFLIDRLPVTHSEYAVFVRDTQHRAPIYWPRGAMPEELHDHPVVGIDYFDALAFAHWSGKDLPFEDEWERAARFTDGRTYPWGNEPNTQRANTARTGLKMTLPVGFHPDNVSPEGVRDLVGNAWELTHSPAPGGGVVVRGGSWYDLALYAKSYFRSAARTNAMNGTIGFRCVRRSTERRDAEREVSAEAAAAEIAVRRTSATAPSTGDFSADRRDLVPDYRRLEEHISEVRKTEPRVALAPKSQVSGSLHSAKAEVEPKGNEGEQLAARRDDVS